MRDYRFYQFWALDHVLSGQERAQLRRISRRALVSSRTFEREYKRGDLKADPLDLMDRYFNLMVYTAERGSRRLMLRWPQRILALETARLYCRTDRVSAIARGASVLVEFNAEDRDNAYAGVKQDLHFFPLGPVWDDVEAGDLRCLYLGWLLSVHDGLPYDYVEPPVPPGRRQLTQPLRTLVRFLRIEGNLLHVAAERSSDLPEAAPEANLRPWLRALQESEKENLLLRLMIDEPKLRAELLRRFRTERAAATDMPAGLRTVGELLKEIEKLKAEEAHSLETLRELLTKAGKREAAKTPQRRSDHG